MHRMEVVLKNYIPGQWDDSYLLTIKSCDARNNEVENKNYQIRDLSCFLFRSCKLKLGWRNVTIQWQIFSVIFFFSKETVLHILYCITLLCKFNITFVVQKRYRVAVTDGFYDFVNIFMLLWIYFSRNHVTDDTWKEKFVENIYDFKISEWLLAKDVC